MPGAIAETKSTPWTVAEQFVEERIKLKQGNSRVALALRNAKIHRPSLYLSAKKSFERALERDDINRTADNNVSKKKTNSRDYKKQRSPQTERKSQRNTRSCRSGAVTETSRSRLESAKLPNASSSVSEETPDAIPETPLGKSAHTSKTDRSDNAVTLKTVNVKPWENDFVKTPSIAEPIAGDIDREKRMDRNISRLIELLHECNERRNDDIKHYSATVQHNNQKLLKPGRIVYPEGTFPLPDNLDNGFLSGVLRISSKTPPNPRCFHRLPPVLQQTMNNSFSSVNRNTVSYRLPALKNDCHVCSECRQLDQKMLRNSNSESESEQLKLLKRKLKLKERAYVEQDLGVIYEKPPALRVVEDDVPCLRLENQTGAKHGEYLSLPKLYLSHHSTNAASAQKSRKTKPKTIDSVRSLDSSSEKKHHCYKLSKTEQVNNADSSKDKKSAKAMKSKESKSGNKCKSSNADQPRVLLTPLRGFTPHWSELSESPDPMLWRENVETLKQGFSHGQRDAEKE